MPLLKKTIEKLAKEGRISKIENPVPSSKYIEIMHKLNSFQRQNYKAGYESRRIILRP
jgi:hypothetical protein